MARSDWWQGVAVWVTQAVALCGCSFPSHRFVDDDEFGVRKGESGAGAEGRDGEDSAVGAVGAGGKVSGDDTAPGGGAGAGRKATEDGGAQTDAVGGIGQDLAGGSAGEGGADSVGGATGGTAMGGTAMGGTAMGGMAMGGAPDAKGGVEAGGAEAGGAEAGGVAVGGVETGGGDAGAASGGGEVELPNVEVCDNGVDDDGDAAVDCTDADCVDDGWGCAPPIPSGWTGPVALWIQSESAPTVECRAAGSYDIARYPGLVGNLSDRSWSCPSCRCGEPEGTTAEVQLSYRSGSDCAGECAFGSELCRSTFREGCNPVVLDKASLTGSLPLSLTVDTVVPIAGQCPALSDDGPLRDAPNGIQGLACASSRKTGTCGDLGICVPTPAAPFEAAPCVVALGELECPDGYTARRDILQTGMEDGRTCSACACDAETGFLQEVEITEYDGGAACDGQSLVVGGVTGCVMPTVDGGLERDERYIGVTVQTVSAGHCEPVPSTPSGAVVPRGDSLTFCCTSR